MVTSTEIGWTVYNNKSIHVGTLYAVNLFHDIIMNPTDAAC